MSTEAKLDRLQLELRWANEHMTGALQALRQLNIDPETEAHIQAAGQALDKAAGALQAELLKRELQPELRRSLNDALRTAGLDGNGRFRSPRAACDAALDVLKAAGIGTHDELRLVEGPNLIELCRYGGSLPLEITNSALMLSLHETPGGIESVAYLS
jgi:hypothetical protein